MAVYDEILKENNFTPITMTAQEIETCKEKATEETLALAFLDNDDKDWYGKCVQDFENLHTIGIDKYPKH